MKGKKIQWTAEMDEALREGYTTKFNFELAKEVGASIRSVVRRLRELELYRPDDFHSYTADQRSALIKAGKTGKPNPGQIQPGEHRNPQGEFGKGRVISQEARIRGARKGAAKRKDTFKRERLREKYGLRRLTKLNVNEPTPNAYWRRSYLRQNGYKVDKSSYVVYYDENTTRRLKFEAKCRNFEFRPMEKDTMTMTDAELEAKALSVPCDAMGRYIEQIKDEELKARLEKVKRDRYHYDND